jgi:hypothetical protein
MNAVLDIIANGGQAFIDINRLEADRNKLISHSLYNFILNPLTAASSTPLRRGSLGCGMFVHENHAARWGCVFRYQKIFREGVVCSR